MAAASIRAVLCVLWLSAIGVGTAILVNYQSASGDMGTTRESWPAELAVPFPRESATLVMFAHPKCPCTRATMEELNRLLARCVQPLATHIFFLTPGDASTNWSQTDLYRSASALPGVEVHHDWDGALAAQFGAKTSGSVFLYDRQGELLFRGGITASRGHAGDNAGASSIVSLLAGKENGLRQTPVYGCSLGNGCVSKTNERISWSK